MQAVILAAGRGKRLGHLTENRSKPMQPILGVPMIGRVVNHLAEAGINEFIFVANPEDSQLKSYLTTLSLDMTFAYQHQPLGMAHALLQASSMIRNSFILAACDNLVPPNELYNFVDKFKTNKYDALLAIKPVPQKQIPQCGIVTLDGNQRITAIIEKPPVHLAPSNIGSVPIYGFSHQILTLLDKIDKSPRGEYELQDAIQELIKRNANVYGFFVSKRFTVTNARDLLNVNLYYLKYLQQSVYSPQGIPPGTSIYPPVYVENGTSIGTNCSIGPNVYIESNVTIQDNCTIKNAVILRHSNVPQNSSIENMVIAPTNVK